MPTPTPHELALTAAQESVRFFPTHEPSAWLRRTSQAAALRLDPLVPGVNYIVPLVPLWPPTAAAPVHLCARCAATSEARSTEFRTCGFQATSGEVVPKFAFELFEPCAVKEYGS